MSRRLYVAVGIVWAVIGAQAAQGAAASAATAPAGEGLTFFAWADQHIQTNGDGKHAAPAIDAMNALPGTAYPASIGGSVARPAFVFGGGDITEWPTHAALRTYERMIQRLKFPAYDIAGNHDSGGKVASATVHKWLIARHGALTYTFDRGGVRFLALHSRFDPEGKPAQPLTRAAMTRLREELARAPKGMPVVVATHLSFQSTTNVDELVKAFGDAPVVLWMGGHYHKAAVGGRGRFHFLQLPSPKSKFPEVTVVRITPGRLVAIPWDYVRKAWTTDRRKILDVRLGQTSSATTRSVR